MGSNPISSTMNEWSDLHVKEAHAATFKLCEKSILKENNYSLDFLISSSRESEETWARDLKIAGLNESEIKKQIKRVNKLASGEWIRETLWIVGDYVCVSGEMKARMIVDQTKETLARRVRIGKL